MALSKDRKGEIALAFLKSKFKKERRLPEAQEIKRGIGNFSKESGIPKEELIEFVVLLVKEVTEEFYSEVVK